METKTKTEILNNVKNYLTKTSKHLFVTGDGFMYKIETLEKDDKLYYATIFLGNGKVIINVKEALSDTRYKNSGNSSLSVIQQELFPAYYKAKSLPYFKKMKAIIADLKADLSTDNTKNKELADKFKDRLSELEITQ